MADQRPGSEGENRNPRTSTPDPAIVWMGADGSVWTNYDQAARLRTEAGIKDGVQTAQLGRVHGLDPKLQIIWIDQDGEVWGNMQK